MIYDVIIIGAGPAGLSTAIHAGKKGLKTVVIEKNKEIGYPMKTSALTWNETMNLLKIRNSSISQLVDTIYIKNHHTKETFEKKYPKPVGCVLDYHNFLRELAEKAIDFGVEIKLNETALREIAKSKLTGVKTNNEKYFSKIVIDCSGPTAIVGKKLRPTMFETAELGIGAEVEMSNVKLENPNRIELHVGKEEVVPVSYGWVFPTGKRKARIGLATVLNTKENIKNVNIEEYLKKFIDKKKSPIAEIIQKAQPIEMHYGAYHLAEPIKNYANNLLLVGDSASQASAMLGEGIRYAVIFGKYAAEVSAEAITENNLSKNKLSEYDKKCRSYLQEHYRVAQQFLNPDTDEYWDKIVKNLKKYPELCLPYMKTELNSLNAEKLLR